MVNERNLSILRSHGYVIDVRGVYPLLIKGQTAIQFPSLYGAIFFALYIIIGNEALNAMMEK